MERLEKLFYQQFKILLVVDSSSLVIMIVFYVVLLLDVDRNWLYIILLTVLFVPPVPFLIKELIGFCNDYRCIKSKQIPKITGEFIGYKIVNVGGTPSGKEIRIIILDQLTNKQIILKGEHDNLQEGNMYTFYYLPCTKFSIIVNS